MGILSDIASTRADGNTFVVVLNTGNADLLYLMTGYHLLIQPDGGKDDPAVAFGSGPYTIVSHEAGVRTVAEENPNYWDAELGHAETRVSSYTLERTHCGSASCDCSKWPQSGLQPQHLGWSLKVWNGPQAIRAGHLVAQHGSAQNLAL